MSNRKVERKELINFGLSLLMQVEIRDKPIQVWKSRLENYQLKPEYQDDDYSWLTCVLALKSVSSRNFGVGSILVDHSGTVIEWGHNEVFNPHFRSDRHAEMVVVNNFEDANQNVNKLEGHTLYTSLESCPMCLARLITSRINKIIYIAEDDTGGMTRKLEVLPTIWTELAGSQIFQKACCSEDLIVAANKIFLINAQQLNEMLRNR